MLTISHCIPTRSDARRLEADNQIDNRGTVQPAARPPRRCRKRHATPATQPDYCKSEPYQFPALLHMTT